MAAEDEALAAFGLKREGPLPEDAAFRVWPENWEAVRMFIVLATQWSVGMNGPTGLRYESLPMVLRMRQVPRAEWSGLFDQVRVMEAEALKYFAEQRGG